MSSLWGDDEGNKKLDANRSTNIMSDSSASSEFKGEQSADTFIAFYHVVR
jgi:hypothetical protein